MWLIYAIIVSFGLFGSMIWLHNLVSWLDEQAERKNETNRI